MNGASPGYELRVGGRSLALFRSLDRAKRIAEDYVSAGRDVRIGALSKSFRRQAWTYDYSLEGWVEAAPE